MDEPKYQWSKFSPDRSEQFVIRTDSWEELISARSNVILIVPQSKAFPEDEGPIAHTEAQVQPPAPICAIHKMPMVWKQGISMKTGEAKPYAFWGCSQRMDNGRYCTYKAPKGA